MRVVERGSPSALLPSPPLTHLLGQSWGLSGSENESLGQQRGQEQAPRSLRQQHRTKTGEDVVN